MSDDMAALMALPDHLPILCWYADATGSIQWYSREWYRYTGTTPEGMAGWGWAKVHHTDTLGEVMLRWVACIAEVKPFCMIFPLRGADGVYRPFLTRATPHIEDGVLIGWNGVNTEVTGLDDPPLKLDMERARAAL